MFFLFSLSFNYRNRTKKDYEHAGSETTWSDLSKLSEEVLNLIIRNRDEKLRIKTRFPPSRRFAEVQEHKRGFCHIFSSVLLRLLRVLGQCLWTRVSISLDTFFLVLLRSLQQNWRATPRRRKQSTRPARAATNCKRNIVHPKRSLQTIEVLTSYLYKHLKYEHLTSKMGNSVDPDSCFSSSTGSCDLETSISLDRVLCIDWNLWLEQKLAWKYEGSRRHRGDERFRCWTCPQCWTCSRCWTCSSGCWLPWRPFHGGPSPSCNSVKSEL